MAAEERKFEPTPGASIPEEKEEHEQQPEERESVGALLRDLRDETLQLFRQEVDLARTETGEKVSQLSSSVKRMAIGGALMLLAAIGLLAMLNQLVTVLLVSVVPLAYAFWLGPLIVAAVLAGIGFAVWRVGERSFRRTKLTPEKTRDTLREDVEWVREKRHHG